MDEGHIHREVGPPNQEARILYWIIAVILVVCIIGYNHLQRVDANDKKSITAGMTAAQQEQADFQGLMDESAQAHVQINCSDFKTKTDVEQCQLAQQAVKALNE